MNKSRLSFLFEKALSNNISDQERKELFQLLAEKGNSLEKEQLFEKARFDYIDDELFFTQKETENLAGSILAEIQIYRHKNRHHYKWLAAAATILVVIGLSVFLYLNTFQTNSSSKPTTVSKNIMPVKNNATLVLSNGKVVMLGNMENGEIKEGDVTITKTANGELVYETTAHDEFKDNQPSENILSTPRGGQYQVVLPDGSKVWLSAASVLHYPTRFKGDRRVVTLKGEAYFDIAKNQTSPFIVHVNGAEIHVLGTSFLVSAYEDVKKTTTTLVEGRVRINVERSNMERTENGTTLAPGQQAVFDLRTKEISVHNVNINDVLAWKSGSFIFQGDNIHTVMKTIERWYDVDVVYVGDVSAETFVGTVSKFDSIEKLLNTIELTGGVHFKIEGRKILVMK